MQNNEMIRPTGEKNPALEIFGHLLPDDGLYSAEDVAIYFNQDLENNNIVSDVAVVYLPRKHIGLKGYKDHPVFEMVSSRYSKNLFQCLSGNCFFKDWMKYNNQKSPPPRDPDTNANLGFGPDEDFQCMKAWGFSSIEEAERAIKEFARIRECSWARDGSIDPLTLVKTASERERKADNREIKGKIYCEEQSRCLEVFELEIRGLIESGKMKCPKNVYMLFNSMLLNGHVAETNPGSLEFKKHWDQLKEKTIRDTNLRIKKRESEILLEDDLKYTKTATSTDASIKKNDKIFKCYEISEMNWRS